MVPGCLDGSRFGLAQERFQFGEHLLDRVQVGGVGRQEEELGTSGADSLAHGLAFVAAEVVQDHHVAGRERGDKALLHIGQERAAIDWAVDDAGRLNAVATQGGQEGQRAPVAMRDGSTQPSALGRAAVRAGQVGLGPGLVKEDEASGVEPALMGRPATPPAGDVRPVLLGCPERLFLNVRPSRAQKRQTAP